MVYLAALTAQWAYDKSIAPLASFKRKKTYNVHAKAKQVIETVRQLAASFVCLNSIEFRQSYSEDSDAAGSRT